MKKHFTLKLIYLVVFTLIGVYASAQINDSLDVKKKDAKKSKMASINEKAMHLFKIIPVPFVTYAQETGTMFGLAKFNLFHLSKKDTISQPSKFSSNITVSTNGHLAFGTGVIFNFGQGKYYIITGFGIRKFPEYLLGIGNDVSIATVESTTVSKWLLTFNALREVKENVYVGIVYDFANFWNIKKDTNSFLIKDNVTGANGGIISGVGPSLIIDSRDNRYNASKGMFFLASYSTFQKFTGSDFTFNNIVLDFRKYYNPWLKHVIAFQIYNDYNYGEVPYFHLSLMGGTDRMRGYYKGAIRDKVLIDGQIEYRMPVWKIFGLAAFFGAGRVFPEYEYLTFKDINYAGGLGLRIQVDSENNTNLRLDFAYGKGGLKAVIFGFAEAF
ncbi:BamA/TamA family outer membrane protein [Bacteroidota bacterium]